MPPRSSALPGTKRILFNTDVPYRLTDAERTGLQSVCPGVDIVQAHGEASVHEVDLRDVNILVTDLNVPRDLGACPQLAWVQLVSAGANQVTHLPIAQTTIAVTTASGLHGVPIAQYVTGALLMLVHQFPRLAAVQATRRWPEQRWDLRGSLLRGATAGIIGYGSIGRECARQLHALGMRIVALDAGGKRDDGYNAWPGTGDPEGKLPERWFGPEQLREMLPLCDALVVAVPLTPRTINLIGAAELTLMKRGARILIISRGGIVNENALADALRSGQIAGAAVDCFVEEPLRSDHVFHDVPNIILTPHIAGAFEGFWPAMLVLFTENLRRFTAGKSLLNTANKQLGY
jgi:phosphoglycerate dehydrogenase-like enzyme